MLQNSILDFSDSSNNGNLAPRSPSRSADDEYDLQMNNISLLKAQLKVRHFKKTCKTMLELILLLLYLLHGLQQLVTHERDMLKKDVKKITMERDGALKHLSLTTGIYVLTLLHSQIYSISLVTLIATFSTKLVCMYTCAFLFVCWGRPVTSREIWFLYYTRSILCSSTITAPSFYYMYFSLESLPLKAKKYTKSTFSGNMELGGHHHHRTASDTASGTSSTSAKPGNVHQISF